jgi:hypothetical protein
MLIYGIGLAVVGSVIVLIGLTYRDAANHEATTTGMIVRVNHGKSTTYHYEFRVNGIKMSDSSGACKTPLTPDGCKKGGQVVVYYTFEPTTNSMLKDFADAAHEKLQWGTGLTAVGLLLIAGSWLMRRSGGSSGSDEEGDGRSQEDASEVLSIAPRD